MKTLSSVLSVLALSSAALAWAGPGMAASRGQCFRMSEAGGWRVTPDARTMYMKVRLHDVFQVDLRGACPALKRIDVHLVHRLSDDMVCSPIEFDLRVADNGGHMGATPCLVGGFHQLSPAEVAALPPKLRP